MLPLTPTRAGQRFHKAASSTSIPSYNGSDLNILRSKLYKIHVYFIVSIVLEIFKVGRNSGKKNAHSLVLTGLVSGTQLMCYIQGGHSEPHCCVW